MSNTHFLSALSRSLAIAFLVVGMECVGTSLTGTLRGQVTAITHVEMPRSPVLRTEGGAKILPGSGLHGAALPRNDDAQMTATMLLIGMLLLLGSFLSYAWYVVRQRPWTHAPALQRFHGWFERKLDEHMGTTRKAHG